MEDDGFQLGMVRNTPCPRHLKGSSQYMRFDASLGVITIREYKTNKGAFPQKSGVLQ
jgi:hypothetical protein